MEGKDVSATEGTEVTERKPTGVGRISEAHPPCLGPPMPDAAAPYPAYGSYGSCWFFSVPSVARKQCSRMGQAKRTHAARPVKGAGCAGGPHGHAALCPSYRSCWFFSVPSVPSVARKQYSRMGQAKRTHAARPVVGAGRRGRSAWARCALPILRSCWFFSVPSVPSVARKQYSRMGQAKRTHAVRPVKEAGGAGCAGGPAWVGPRRHKKTRRGRVFWSRGQTAKRAT